MKNRKTNTNGSGHALHLIHAAFDVAETARVLSAARIGRGEGITRAAVHSAERAHLRALSRYVMLSFGLDPDMTDAERWNLAERLVRFDLTRKRIAFAVNWCRRNRIALAPDPRKGRRAR